MSRIGTADADARAAAILSALLEARTGQQLAAARSWRIDAALGPLLAMTGARDAEALVERLVGADDSGLADRIVDALLNQETSFFRDAGVLAAAAAAITDGTVARGRAGRRPRIWCAGCATGQEPLSLAMQFAEGNGTVPEIVATDVSDGALSRARLGRFTQFEVQRGLSVRRMVRWFDAVEGDWIARPELMGMVSFRRHNLVADAPPTGRFDAIFCRNVLFYLHPTMRRAVFERLASALRPGGLLVLGAGETVIGLSDQFRPSQRFRGLYERVPHAPLAARRGLG